ncbi:MAG: hypothetical protein POELPBGB_00479 [Bacteroidia bacterium]|nr:hypothetical protein [Bacteroidia bacterium]
MKKHLLLCLTLAALSLSSQAQTAISATGVAPDASAMFEVVATDKGMLIPRVALTSTAASAPVTSPLTSLLVYNTAAVSDVTPGYYYWNGTSWTRLLNGATNLSGSGTTNYLARWTPNGNTLGIGVTTDNGTNVGIGSTSPTQKLTVAGNINKSGSWIAGDAVWGANTFEIHNNSWDGVSNGNYGGITGGHGYYYGGLQSGGGGGNEAAAGEFYVSGKSMLIGSVGVGTTTPSGKLDVSGTTSDLMYLRTSTAESDIDFRNSGAGAWQVGTNNSGNGTSGNQFYIYDNNTGYLLTVQRGNGSVGIGTTSPSFKLHVPSGYIGTDYINTSDNSVSSGVTGVMVKAGDNYLRTGTAAAVTTFLNSNNGWIQNQFSGEQSANFMISGTGQMDILQFNGVGGNSGVGNQSYAIYQEGGSWSHPYPDLAIGYHTGIKLGAHYSYNGIRFYNNSDFATQTFSVGDGDNNVRVYYNIATVGDIVSNQNYGLGLVGLYASTRYQNVFAMGASYRLAADGTTPGNLYGLAWTHSNVGGQSISNLGHQLLVMSNGGTTAAIGNGFWSSYGIDVGGNGTYNRFRTWTELTGAHGLYSGVNGAHFYPNDASYGSWRILGTRNGWGGLEFPSGSGNISLMIGQGGWGGMTTGMHANSYGWLWRFEHQTLYCSRWVDTDNTGYYFDGHSTTYVTGDFWANTHGGVMRIGHGAYGGDWCCGGYDWWGCQGWCSNIRLSVYGGAESLGWYGWSDGRFKKDVQTVSNALDLVKSMRGVFYNWTFEGTTPSYDEVIKAAEKKEYNPEDIEASDGSPPGSRIGVIAQEIQEVLPQVVTRVEDKDTAGTVIGHHYSVNYNDIVPVLIEAIKEQQIQIEELKAKVFGLSSQNNLLLIEEKLKQSQITDKNSFIEFIESIKNKNELDQQEKLKLELLKNKLGIK